MVVESDRQEAEQKKAVPGSGDGSLESLGKNAAVRREPAWPKIFWKGPRIISATVQSLRARHKSVVAEKVKAFRDKIAEFLPSPSRTRPGLPRRRRCILQRFDISEEMTRLDSHLTALQETLREKGSVGRKLDFLIQEMNRETNTIGSKSADSKMAHGVVRLKELLEQIREQIQNIE